MKRITTPAAIDAWPGVSYGRRLLDAERIVHHRPISAARACACVHRLILESVTVEDVEGIPVPVEHRRCEYCGEVVRNIAPEH